MADHRWRSDLLGKPRSVAVDGGALGYFERGDGRPLVFSHGWLSNANLWRAVVDSLHEEFRCIALDLPLGSHRTPMEEDADLTPTGVGRLIAEAVETLGLEDAILVGNDSGGAYSQIALAGQAERIGKRVSGLVLTSCETPYDEWPPPPFDGLPRAARDTGVLGQLLGALEDPAIRTTPPAYGLLLKRPTDPRASNSYALPAAREAGVLRDVAKAIASTSTDPVRQAGECLIATSDLPVLLIWSSEDTVFPLANARRYAGELGRAELVEIDDAYSFTPEDRPDAVTAAIAGFALRIG